MSTESQTPPAEAPSPGAAVRAAWGKFKRGELVSYRVMAVVLIIVTGVGVVLYMKAISAVGASRMWVDLEAASSPDDLEKVATDYPNTVPGQLAEFHLARIKLGPDGIDQLVTGDDAQRKKALANVEAAKEAFTKLSADLKDSPVLLAECYLGLAQAELALIGITKDNRISDFRGSPARAAEWLDKLADVAAGTPWGDDAKKTAADLRKPGGALEQDIIRTQTVLYTMSFFPPPRGGFGGPLGPGGGLPPGFQFGPAGGIPGLPGGGAMMPPLPPGHP